MNKAIQTDEAPPPFSRYAQALEVPPGARWVHVSGQVGIGAAGLLPEDDAAQHELAWRNVFAVLAAAGMGPDDIVEVIAIVTGHEQVPVYRVVRDRVLGQHVCASTMLVCGLADPAWKVEIAVRAARVERPEA